MLFIVFQLFFTTFNNYEIYAADNTAPFIKCSIYKDTNSGKNRLKITVTDNKSIKSVKYALGNHRKSFFKDSFVNSVSSTLNI